MDTTACSISHHPSLLRQNSSNIVSVIAQQTTKSNHIQSNPIIAILWFVIDLWIGFICIETAIQFNWYESPAALELRFNNHILSNRIESNQIKYVIASTLSISANTSIAMHVFGVLVCSFLCFNRTLHQINSSTSRAFITSSVWAHCALLLVMKGTAERLWNNLPIRASSIEANELAPEYFCILIWSCLFLPLRLSSARNWFRLLCVSYLTGKRDLHGCDANTY